MQTFIKYNNLSCTGQRKIAYQKRTLVIEFLGITRTNNLKLCVKQHYELNHWLNSLFLLHSLGCQCKVSINLFIYLITSIKFHNLLIILKKFLLDNINLSLITKCKGHTEEYCPEVVQYFKCAFLSMHGSSKQGLKVDYYMALRPCFANFQNKNMQLMAIAIRKVGMEKSWPRKKQSKCSARFMKCNLFTIILDSQLVIYSNKQRMLYY